MTDFLLNKGYKVHGLERKKTVSNLNRLYSKVSKNHNFKNLKIHYGDLSDQSSIIEIIFRVKPSEIYNLGAQSDVATSFLEPVYTSDVNALGTLRILEAIRILKLNHKVRVYQASTSELFGENTKIPQNENTFFQPVSPYAISKLYSYWIIKNYRKSYNFFAVNGILFNHESPLRGEKFVTKKIVSSLIKIKLGKQKKLYLGNLYSKRDWGHAEDYVIMMWKMLQYNKPEDFVISTGKQFTIKEFVNKVSKKLNMKIVWKNKGLKETGFWLKASKNYEIIKISKKLFRPSEVNNLLGDSTKAKKLLKWQPKKNIEMLIDDMINFEIENNQ